MTSTTYLGFAPEVQAAVDAIRSTWTSEDHEFRNSDYYYVPDTFVTADDISRYFRRRELENAPPPPKPKPVQRVRLRRKSPEARDAADTIDASGETDRRCTPRTCRDAAGQLVVDHPARCSRPGAIKTPTAIARTQCRRHPMKAGRNNEFPRPAQGQTGLGS